MFVLMALALVEGGVLAAGPKELFVATGGSNKNPGTAEKPLATLHGAQAAITAMKTAGPWPAGGVRVNVGAGQFFLAEPLTLGPEDSGTADSPIVYAGCGADKTTISGGRIIAGWTNKKDNLWTVELPEVKAGKWYFRQLFADGKRLTRARTPNEGYFLTEGALTAYAEMAKKRQFGGSQGIPKLRLTNPDLFCGFQYKAGDIQPWPDAADAEIITFHSWECSWQTIRKIDGTKRDIHFNSPCRYPVGNFSLHARYRIENIRETLDEPGEWYLDRKNGVLHYLSRPGEDPRKMQFIAPVLERLLVLAGDLDKKAFVHHVAFEGLAFAHNNYPMGIYDVARDWPAPALKVAPTWPKTFPPGYTDAQAAPLCGSAVELTAAQDCAFRRCRVAMTGNYAISIGQGSKRNVLSRCLLEDLGGGGVKIGRYDRTPKWPPEESASHNVVENCTIRHTSLVHPSAVGIAIAQSDHNRLMHNEITDVGYAGTHIGWTWGRTASYTHDNLVEGNHVHHVMRDLADAGGFYSLGINTGMVYRENYIHDITRAKDAIGAPVNGIFFDEGSRDIRLERNVIRVTGGTKPTRFNKCVQSDFTWVDNDLGKGKSKLDSQAIIDKAGPAKE